MTTNSDTPITDRVRERKDDYLGAVDDLELSHADLLAAAEAALPAIRWGMTHQPGNMIQFRDVEAQLIAAIAAAYSR